jgi:hypothetical protein
MTTMQAANTIETLLPHAAPVERTARAVLLAIRRIASGGLADASATNIFMGAFGIGYRRPLMFLRVMMNEVSRISQEQIAIAPCCCPRMTDGEAIFLMIIQCGRAHPDMARGSLARITGSLDTLSAVSVAQALAASLDDLGRPLVFGSD